MFWNYHISVVISMNLYTPLFNKIHHSRSKWKIILQCMQTHSLTTINLICDFAICLSFRGPITYTLPLSRKRWAPVRELICFKVSPPWPMINPWKPSGITTSSGGSGVSSLFSFNLFKGQKMKMQGTQKRLWTPIAYFHIKFTKCSVRWQNQRKVKSGKNKMSALTFSQLFKFYLLTS